MAAGRERISFPDPGVKIIVSMPLIIQQMRAPELQEPGVVRTGVVQRKIQDQLYIPFMAQGDQLR